MRPLVEPPPSLRCTCGGELRLKLIEPADRAFRKQKEIFVCPDCSRERTFLADRKPLSGIYIWISIAFLSVIARHPNRARSQCYGWQGLKGSH